MRYRIATGLVCLLLALCIPLVSAAPVSDILYPAVPAGTVNATLASADLNGNPGNAGFVTGLALRRPERECSICPVRIGCDRFPGSGEYVPAGYRT